MKTESINSQLLIFLTTNLFLFNNSLAQTFSYPPTSKSPVVDTIFGKKVVDDYRWLEDLNSPKVKNWLKDQADYTTNILNNIPGRDSLFKEFKQIDASTPYTILFENRKGGKWFYKKTLAGENEGKLYYRQGERGKEILLFDPATYEKGKEWSYAFIPSKDGKKVLLMLTEKGIEISTNRILDVDSRNLYSEIVYPGSMYPGSFVTTWTPDGKGFIYTKRSTTNHSSTDFSKNLMLMYHAIGTAAEKDKEILSAKNYLQLNIKPEEILLPEFSADEKYFFVTLFQGWQNQNRRIFIPASEVLKENASWKTLVKSSDLVQQVIVYKNDAYILSRKDAPKGKILKASLSNLENVEVIVPEGDLDIVTFEALSLSRDFLFIRRTDGINSAIDKYNFNNHKIQSVKLPYKGSAWIGGFDTRTNDCWLGIYAWKKPVKKYNYNPVTNTLKHNAFNVNVEYPGVDDLVADEIEVRGHDGVNIPLSLIYNKRIKRDGKNVVYMIGYGSYGLSTTPFFSPTFLPLLNKGIIVAFAHVRGGGEKGNAWHMAGFKTTKPNTWKDFISCAEYLIKHKYTSAEHLIGEGNSAGGILIGRTITERPDLFAATIHGVPVSNALRHEIRSIGGTDSQEFGTIKDSIEAMALIEMDAYLNVKQGLRYPAVLATAGINDSRVPAWQPGKLVAAMQTASASDKPILLKVNYESGHGSEGRIGWLREFADNLAFALWQAGHKDFQPVQKK